MATGARWRARSPPLASWAPGSTTLSIAGQTGNAVIVQAGAAFIDGLFYNLDANTTVALANNTSSSPRIALVVLRLDPTAKTIALVPKYGTPSSTPAAPALSQLPDGVFELALGHVTQPPSGQAQTPYAHTDARQFAGLPLITGGKPMHQASASRMPLQIDGGTGLYLTNQFGQFTLDTAFRKLVAISVMSTDSERVQRQHRAVFAGHVTGGVRAADYAVLPRRHRDRPDIRGDQLHRDGCEVMAEPVGPDSSGLVEPIGQWISDDAGRNTGGTVAAAARRAPHQPGDGEWSNVPQPPTDERLRPILRPEPSRGPSLGATSSYMWWGGPGLNRRPMDYESTALTN